MRWRMEGGHLLSLEKRPIMNSRRCHVCDYAYPSVVLSGARPSSTRPESHDGGFNDASVNLLAPERLGCDVDLRKDLCAKMPRTASHSHNKHRQFDG